MSHSAESNFQTLVRRRQNVEPIFHPNLRRTLEVIRRPDWVQRAGEAVAHRGSIGFVGLFALMFANCFGGGYGFEDTVGAAGPLVTLVVCLILPWIWSLPTGLAVAELSTAVPSNSGILMWVNAAFPASVSFMCIISTVFITFVGNATYPSLTSEYVDGLLVLNKGGEIGVKIGVIAFCCILNCAGVEIVGSACVVVCVIAMMPFLILSFQQIFTHGLDGKAISHVDFSSIDWPSFLSMVTWNYANIENAGAMVEEVSNPRTTFPRMMIPLMFSSYIAYLLPMLAGVSALGPHQNWSEWQAGRWPQIALIISGEWLKYYLFAGAIVSGLGFTLTSMCCTSRLLAGMGTMEMFPKKISRIIGYYHPTIGTPIPAILLNSTVTMIFCISMDFGEVVAMCQSLYCLRMLLIYASLIKLRIDHPNLPRPYALPCNTAAAAMCLAPSAIFCIAAAIVSAMVSLPIGLSVVCFLIVGSGGSYLYCRYIARNGFQGVIVNCEVSDDDNNSADSNGEGHEIGRGIFYNDGHPDRHGERLLGIFPTALPSPTEGEELSTAERVTAEPMDEFGKNKFGCSPPTAAMSTFDMHREITGVREFLNGDGNSDERRLAHPDSERRGFSG
ncbi:putative amino acid permease [Trypanosoma rangeli]|uniref:Putative amino acid permease n=1 Tax=Trypanosoma rangeli TaxID=5698 RepID=A0A3R7M6P3_TRYRA|nr:putative amino acid permease [Trypanosoma rangeli]RNF10080.1 putative amino acid permease [Trypanosoma rangeli]|eukprot:RNF10080.1 putative amino acid permease [Trypanosoma rangeli]